MEIQNKAVIDLLEKRYLLPGEGLDAWVERVSMGNDDIKPYINNLDFLPNSPALMNCGTPLGQLAACFVLPVGDSIDSIYDSLKAQALIHKSGGGTGWNFSNLRPEGSAVKSTNGVASGPCSFMQIFDASTNVVRQGGKRRGANMGILDISHPDIRKFIHLKADTSKLNNFNLSVNVTGWSQFANTTLMREIASEAWASGEPGLLFQDNINKNTPARYLEKYGPIKATNPCVTADTWVLTHKGWRQVKDLAGKSFFALVNGKPYLSTGFWKTGIKPVYRLETKEGYSLDCTLDHKIVIPQKNGVSRKIPLRSLFPGDKVVLSPNSIKDVVWDEDEYHKGYSLGVLLGDGTLKKDSSPILTSWGHSKKPIRDYIGGNWAFCDRSKSPNEYQEEYRLQNNSLLKPLALSHGVAWGNKIITNEIIAESFGFQAGFLAGLFDCDSCVIVNFKKGSTIQLSQSNLETLKKVQIILAGFGIISKVYNGRPSHLEKMPDHKGGYKLYQCKSQYRLYISKRNINIYYELIGTKDPDKEKKLQEIIDNTRFYKESFTGTIKSIKPIGKREVYDCTVSDVHVFYANGICVSNCGEQDLYPFEACILGSINLSHFVSGSVFLFDKYKQCIRAAIAYLDDMIDVAKWPLPEIEQAVKRNRRIGLGVMGFADCLIKLGVPYDSQAAIDWSRKLGAVLHDESYNTSVERGKNLGNAWGVQRRNVACNTIAPTGTLSLIAGCSSGIEPLFALSFVHHTTGGQDIQVVNPLVEDALRGYPTAIMLAEKTGSIKGIHDMLPPHFKRLLKTANEIPWQQHIKIQAAWQESIDSSISKTINMPESASVEDVAAAYTMAHEMGCKGITVYRDGCRPHQVLTAGAEKKEESTQPLTVVSDKIPDCLEGHTSRARTGCGKIYLTQNYYEDKLKEVFLTFGRSGGCKKAFMEVVGRLVSTGLKYGITPKELAKQLKGVKCSHPFYKDKKKYESCLDMVGQMIYNTGEKAEKGLKCPRCGSNLVPQGGCWSCPECGFSKCE